MVASDLHPHPQTDARSIGPTRRERRAAVRRARVLNVATIGWNTVEGVAAIVAGVAAGSVSLVGFGIDSAIRGAFRLARNPIFSAMAITAVGLAAMVPNVIAVGGLIALIVAIELQVRSDEEPYLQRMHGTAYDRYAAHVGRFLPQIGRLPVA